MITPTPASAPNGIAPNGIGATTSELLFSQPFCMTAGQPRGIYSATNFTTNGSGLNATVTQTTSLPETGCAENYFFISPGTGGFPAGTVYATVPTSSSTDAVYQNGSPFITGIPDSHSGHAGITFDTVGTFNLALIVTTASDVFGYDNTGKLFFTYPTPSGYLLESATVAPLANVGCPGCLYITAEGVAVAENINATSPNGEIYIVRPGSPSGTVPTPVATTPGVEPEGILFVTPQTCKLNGTNFSYFVSSYASGAQEFTSPSSSGALLAYSQSQLPPVGMALVPQERTGDIHVFNPTTNTFTPFSEDIADQLEGAAMVTCASPANGCPATQGFWKNHATPPALTIGGVSYSSSQLQTILQTPPQGGNAALILMHQLIAALANEAAGAKNVGVTELGVNVNLAIAEAEDLLQFGLPQPGFPGTNPGGLSFPLNFNNSTAPFVPASSTLGGYLTTLSNILDAYNSAVGLNCSEGSGLNP